MSSSPPKMHTFLEIAQEPSMTPVQTVIKAAKLHVLYVRQKDGRRDFSSVQYQSSPVGMQNSTDINDTYVKYVKDAARVLRSGTDDPAANLELPGDSKMPEKYVMNDHQLESTSSAPHEIAQAEVYDRLFSELHQHLTGFTASSQSAAGIATGNTIWSVTAQDRTYT